MNNNIFSEIRNLNHQLGVSDNTDISDSKQPDEDITEDEKIYEIWTLKYLYKNGASYLWHISDHLGMDNSNPIFLNIIERLVDAELIYSEFGKSVLSSSAIYALTGKGKKIGRLYYE